MTLQFIRRLINFLLRMLLRGVVIIAPIGLTIFSLYWVFNFIDHLLPHIIGDIFYFFFPNKNITHYPGIGITATFLILIIAGYLSTFILLKKVLKYLESYFEKIPVVNYIYSMFKDLSSLVNSDKKKFSNAVAFYEANKNVKRIGFITKDNMKSWGQQDFVAVYVPLSFSMAGNIFLVHKSRLEKISMPYSEVMKFIISGGVTSDKKAKQ